MSLPTGAWADVEEHAEELAEPIFTKRSFPEKEIEVEVLFDDKEKENEVEIGIGASAVLFDRLQLGLEIPYVVRNPERGRQERNLGDVELSGKYLVYQAPENRFIFSIDAEVAVPSGSENKEIGGTGEWGVFMTAGSAVPLGGSVPDLGVHVQFGFEQQVRLSDEQKEEAEEPGNHKVKEKELVWNIAINMPLFDGILIPTFEVLGTEILEAIEDREEGTIIELAGGFWLAPFEHDSPLEDLAFGVSVKAPVTDMKERNVAALFIAKWEFH